MTIDKAKLKALAERAVASNPPGGDGNPFPALGVRAVDVLALLTEIERLATSRSKKERELEQELETWRHGPFCWACGDTGDVHDITGEWRGECDCLSAQLINANRERDQLKAENEILSRDSERLEFVVSKGGKYHFREYGDKTWAAMDCGSGLSFIARGLPSRAAAIDAAMAKEASHE